MIIDAGWTPPTTGVTIGDWPADVAVTGVFADWRIYSVAGLERTPTNLVVIDGFLVFFYPPYVLPDRPAALELVNPLSLAADVDGLPLVTGGRFPVRTL